MNQIDKNFKRCKKCLLPASTPGIQFYDDGVCNICKMYKQEQVLGKAELLKLLKNYTNLSQPYDCILPISGGLDYTAFYLKNRLSIKCLGVHYDTGLASETSINALAFVEKKLGIPIAYKRMDPQQTKKMIRNSIRSLINFGPKYMQAALCRHCGFGIRAAVYSEMVSRNLPSVWGHHTMDKVPFRYCQAVDLKKYLIQKKWRYVVLSFFDKYKQMKKLKPPGFSIRNLLFNQFGYPDISKSHQHLPKIPFFKYVQWDKDRMLKELKEAGIDTTVLLQPHSDCKLSPIVDHILRAAWTVGKKEIYVCNRIRSGQLSHEKGAEIISEIQLEKPDPSILTEIRLKEDEAKKLFINP